MPVMGELGDFDVGGILQLLSLRRSTGKLRITAHGDEVDLFVAGGRITLVSSTRWPIRLGHVLQQRGLLTSEQLRTALLEQEMADPPQALGQILIDHGWITPAQLTEGIIEQCVAVLARIVSATEGSFIYTSKAKIPPQLTPIPLDADRILLEAARRVDELGSLRSLLPDPSQPLTVTPAIDRDGLLLTNTEARVVSALRNGAESLMDVAEQVDMEESLLLLTLAFLRDRGLIVAEPRSEQAA
jgi:hypothetical protein